MSEKTAEQPVGSAPNIPWRSSLGEAWEEARQSGKLVFVYLWHHFCGGSKTMGERTYPDETARSCLERHFVPVRFNTIEDPSVLADFGSGWTPRPLLRTLRAASTAAARATSTRSGSSANSRWRA